jgi:hypothetical protein
VSPRLRSVFFTSTPFDSSQAARASRTCAVIVMPFRSLSCCIAARMSGSIRNVVGGWVGDTSRLYYKSTT